MKGEKEYSSLYEEQKDCKHRVCTSFEDLMKWGRKSMQKSDKFSGSQSKTEIPKSKRTDCPVDKDELGRSTWNLLHTMSVYYPEKPTEVEQRNMNDMLIALSKTYPCEPCAKDFREDLAKNPPNLQNRDRFARWMCDAHNRVNLKLGKELFDCDKVLERWFEGWKDGSCDP